jgi:hypothetical protein
VIRILLLFCCFLSIQKDEAVLSWNESYSLNWSDFHAKPNINLSAVAITVSGITFGFSVKQTDSNRVLSFTTDVHAHFYPEQSWYKKGQADTHVLGHEQLHFDITELFARKFRMRIKSVKVSNNVNRELKLIHKNILKEMSQMQDTYDYETNFSRNFEAQIKWNVFIKEELQKLSHYKSRE